jgi:hypothetical protein
MGRDIAHIQQHVSHRDAGVGRREQLRAKGIGARDNRRQRKKDETRRMQASVEHKTSRRVEA